jgi:hypothetical protein
MNELHPVCQITKAERLNKTNLKRIGFELSDEYEDPEIGYSCFKHKEIEVTVETDGWYCELNIGRETIKAIGVQSFSDIQSLKNLMYGNQDN